jgi:hypothetical protein
MKCNRFAVKVLVSLSLLGTAMGFPISAVADENTEWTHVTDWKNANGDTLVEYVDLKSGWLLVEFWGKDGRFWTVKFKPSGDPGPDDTSGKGSQPVDVVGLIKSGQIKYQVRLSPENTPLVKWLDREGNGANPHWNPGDNDTGNGPGKPTVHSSSNTPTSAQKAAIARMINADARALQAIGTSMGDVGDLAGESAPGLPGNKNSGSSGRGKGSSNGSDNNKGKNRYLGTDTSLGPRPQFVNPPHSGNRPSAAMNSGLLDSGSTSSSTNGPSGVGTPAGVSGGGSRGVSGAGIR